MSSSIGSKPYDLLETAYQVGKYIHSKVNTTADKNKNRIIKKGFQSGPNSFFSQTKKGLVLETYYYMPFHIHTPYGSWQILGNGSGDFKKVFDAVKEPLGLVLLESKQKNVGGPFFAITKWKGKTIEMPEYKTANEYTSYNKAKKVWDLFKVKHSELAPRRVQPPRKARQKSTSIKK